MYPKKLVSAVPKLSFQAGDKQIIDSSGLVYDSGSGREVNYNFVREEQLTQIF